MKINNKGIGAVVVLLSIIAVSVVGFVGYYVWNTQQDKSKTNSEEVVKTTEPVVNEDTKTEQQNSNSNNVNAIVIKELGVQIPYDGADNVVYVYDDTDRETLAGNVEASVSFFIKEGVLSDSSCNDLGVSLYVLNIEPVEGDYNKVGDKYYAVTGSPSYCGTEDDNKVRSPAISAINISNIRELQ